MDSSVIAFCRARQRFKDVKHRESESWAEMKESKRVTLDLLRESMQKHGTECVALPVDRDGVPRFARLVPPPKKYVALKTKDDVLKLVSKIREGLKDVPVTKLPDAIADEFSRRAVRDDGRVDARVKVVKTLPRALGDASSSPPTNAEVTRLAKAFTTANDELRVFGEHMKPLRAKEKEAEQKMLPFLKSCNEPVRLRLERDGGEKIVTVALTTPKPSSTPLPPKPIGIRRAVRCVRNAVIESLGDLDAFDDVFPARLSSLLDRELTLASHGGGDAQAKVRVTERTVRRLA